MKIREEREPMPLKPQYENVPLRAVNASFDPETGIIQINLDKVTYGFVDQAVRYQDNQLQPTSELHITILSQDAPVLLKHLEDHPDDLNDIQDLVVSSAWTYLRQGQYYFVEEAPDVVAIIERVEVPELTQFLRDVSKLVGKGLTLPPTHVTLYTLGTEKGIGMASQTEFDQKIKGPVQLEEMELLDNPPAPQA